MLRWPYEYIIIRDLGIVLDLTAFERAVVVGGLTPTLLGAADLNYFLSDMCRHFAPWKRYLVLSRSDLFCSTAECPITYLVH